MHGTCWECDRCCSTWCQYVAPIWFLFIGLPPYIPVHSIWYCIVCLLHPCAPCDVGIWHREHKVDVRGLIEFEVWDAEQHLIPNLQQLIPPNISIEEWIINAYVNSLLIILVRLCDSLPTMVKVPKLVWWAVILAWSGMSPILHKY